MTRFLGGLDPRDFLARFWQREPLLVRAAIEGVHGSLTKEELVALSCRDGVEARLVVGDDSGRFEVEHGPFEISHLANMPDNGWTLLVQDVDKHSAEARELLEAVRFMPSWRVDDVMASYAADRGTVGPHVDSYDVFLLQGSGRRRWQVSRRSFEEEAHPETADLRTLACFEPEEEWVLEPGDMLYVPPGVAHYGVALGDCVTYSLGFRAPTDRELFVRVADSLVDRLVPERRFSDPGRPPATHPGEIELTDREQLRQLVRRAMEVDDSTLDRFIARALTEGKPHLIPEPRDERCGAEEVMARLDEGASLCPTPMARWAFVDPGGGPSFVYVDGQEYPLPRAIAEPLTEGQPLDRRRIPQDVLRASAPALADLLAAGYLMLASSIAPSVDDLG